MNPQDRRYKAAPEIGEIDQCRSGAGLGKDVVVAAAAWKAPRAAPIRQNKDGSHVARPVPVPGDIRATVGTQGTAGRLIHVNGGYEVAVRQPRRRPSPGSPDEQLLAATERHELDILADIDFMRGTGLAGPFLGKLAGNLARDIASSMTPRSQSARRCRGSVLDGCVTEIITRWRTDPAAAPTAPATSASARPPCGGPRADSASRPRRRGRQGRCRVQATD